MVKTGLRKNLEKLIFLPREIRQNFFNMVFFKKKKFLIEFLISKHLKNYYAIYYPINYYYLYYIKYVIYIISIYFYFINIFLLFIWFCKKRKLK